MASGYFKSAAKIAASESSAPSEISTVFQPYHIFCCTLISLTPITFAAPIQDVVKVIHNPSSISNAIMISQSNSVVIGFTSEILYSGLMFVTVTFIVLFSLRFASSACDSCTGTLKAKISANTKATIFPLFCFLFLTRVFLSFIRFFATLLEVQTVPLYSTCDFFFKSYKGL